MTFFSMAGIQYLMLCLLCTLPECIVTSFLINFQLVFLITGTLLVCVYTYDETTITEPFIHSYAMAIAQRHII